MAVGALMFCGCANASVALEADTAASETAAQTSQAQASSTVAASAHDSDVTEVGHKGEVTIDPTLEHSGQKPNLSAGLIKTLGLDRLLRVSQAKDFEGKPLSLEDLLAQKLQRLEQYSQANAAGAAKDASNASDASDGASPSESSTGSKEIYTTESNSDATATAEESAESVSESSQEAMPPYKPQVYDTGILDINGTYVEYVDGFLVSEAPAQGAALWAGSDATEDGFLGYFIGHNPGDFTPVLSLTLGDPVTVYDRFDDERTYHVVDTFVVPNTSRFIDIEERLFGYGESIALQTCLDDNENFLVVVAA